MLEIEYVVALTIALSEFIKRATGDKLDDKLTGFIALFIGAGLNALNAYLFGGDIAQAAKEGFIAAFAAVGIFSVSKNTLQSVLNVTKEK